MASFEVFPPEDQQAINPFRAVVGSDWADYSSGMVYVEPPVYGVSEELLTHIGLDSALKFEHRASTDTATVFRYEPDTWKSSRYQNGKEAAEYAVKRLLTELGHMTSAKAFGEHWGQFAQGKENDE